MKNKVLMIWLCLWGLSLFAAPPSGELAALEKKLGGRLGLAVLDTGSGKAFAYRSDERFPMASTFKLILAAAILNRVDRGEEQLDRLVPYTAEDLLDWAPVTRARIGEKALSIRDLCAAIIEQSDNPAANLLLKTLGGPAGLTRFARSLGDDVFRLDRDEPSLNEAAPGDERDTTSPSAMLASMKKLLVGDGLTEGSRSLIVDWMKGCATGKNRLRAAAPADWVAGDKTGTGYNGSSNDLAIFWPPNRAPIIMVAYSTGSPLSGPEREAILVEAAQILIHHLGFS
jgi:beta-lactamase class A